MSSIPSCLAIVLALCSLYFTTGSRLTFKNKGQSSIVAYDGESSVRLPCNVVGPTNSKYQWFRGGKLLTKSRKYVIKKMKSLKILDVSLNDNGTYKCVASKGSSRIMKTVDLLVVDKHSSGEGKEPVFTKAALMKSNKQRTVKSADRVVFWCSVKGFPKPNVIWLHNGKYVPIDSGDYTRVGDDLVLYSAFKDGEGNYTCIASNIYGIIRAEYMLAVEVKTRSKPVIQNIKNRTAYVGENVTIECKAVAKVKPTFSLYKNVVHNGTVGLVETRQNNTEKLEDWGGEARWFRVVWLLKEVTFDDQGFYTCGATNMIGTSKRQFYLKIKQREPPKATTTTLPVTPASRDNGGLNGIHIGLICFVAVVVIVLVFFLIFCMRKRKQGGKADLNENAVENTENGNVASNIPLIVRSGKFRTRFGSNLSQASEIPLDEEWEIPRQNIHLLEVIGEGAFGKVLKAEALQVARTNSNRLIVAVKTLKDDATDVELSDLISELEVMKSIAPHKNIINLIGCCTQNGAPLVVVEYAPYGNLREFLRDRRPNRPGGSVSAYCGVEDVLTLRDFVSFAYQIARGMEYLASMKCIHRDLAARNVLVGNDKVMKIADFGLARDIHKIDYYRKRTDGRLPVKWMALEALFDRVYTTQSDVWAFGVLTWEIFTFGGTPYPSVPLEKLFELLKSGYRMERPVNCPPQLYDLLLRCWLEEPHKRPNFPEIVKELNKELESMTSEEYIDIQSPLLSPMTPRSPSESAPTHGLSPIQESLSTNAFDCEENEHADEDDEDQVFLDENEKLVDNTQTEKEPGAGESGEGEDELGEPTVGLIPPNTNSGPKKVYRSKKESNV